MRRHMFQKVARNICLFLLAVVVLTSIQRMNVFYRDYDVHFPHDGFTTAQYLEEYMEIEENPVYKPFYHKIVYSFMNMIYTKHRTNLLTTTTSRDKKSVFLLILVNSHIKHSERRQAIRDTWGSEIAPKNNKYKTMFLIGRSHNTSDLKQARRESLVHNDIILGNFFENFYKLTFKIQMGFEWASTYCNFSYLLKADDDVFVHVAYLIDYLSEHGIQKKRFFAGNKHLRPVVSRTGKYGVTKEEYKSSKYPPYCSGAGYILSKDVIKSMLPLFREMRFHKIDDAYVGILARRLFLNIIKLKNIKVDALRCNLVQNVMIQHPVKTRNCMLNIMKDLYLQENRLK